MSTQFDDDEEEDFEQKPPTPVPQLEWYHTLRILLEPYQPADKEADADHHMTSVEIIQAIEQHHGVPQGIVGKKIYEWVLPEDFVRAMRYLGYREVNAGGLQLHWLLKKKS